MSASLNKLKEIAESADMPFVTVPRAALKELIAAMDTIKELRSALIDARAIILEDLGTEIESIENALSNSEEYKNE